MQTLNQKHTDGFHDNFESLTAILPSLQGKDIVVKDAILP
jgi:hypothetical protein